MHQFKVGDQVFPKQNQQLPAFTVLRAGPVIITVCVGTHRELVHYADLIARDPAVSYEPAGYYRFQ